MPGWVDDTLPYWLRAGLDSTGTPVGSKRGDVVVSGPPSPADGDLFDVAAYVKGVQG